MKQQKRSIRFGVVAITALCLTVGAVLAAGPGSQSDPLITLSYLNETATPAILEQLDGKTAAYEQSLADKLDASIKEYSQKMDELLAQQGEQQHAATYLVVTLKKDQVLNMDIGCEVMLRVGTAACVSPSAPGLIDTTDGSTLNNGAALVKNHLYMATITERAVKATAATTKVLVRGGYTIA